MGRGAYWGLWIRPWCLKKRFFSGREEEPWMESPKGRRTDIGVEGTTDQRGRSNPPECTTSRKDRQIVSMAVTDRSVTSRTIAQHIESVAHHSVSACTIGRRLQHSDLSARRPLRGLLFTQNHRRLRR
ncbi:transposable element Tcb1 transposase [Trichonephila clavipes]|nr:transposable element Tcb1 transposase [Trichonephila clavipes]